MAEILYNLVSRTEGSSLTAFIDGDMYIADDNHPNWKAILNGVLANDKNVTELFDISNAVAERFSNLSERVSVSGGSVYFDGDEVHSALTDKIVEFLEADVTDFMPLVNFFEKVMQNPNEHSREQLYRWLEKNQIPINSDGDIVAYKGVALDSEDEEGKVWKSINSGTAIVNGVVQTGQIKQRVGDVVEMPRSKVAWNPEVGCATGLHAGDWSYASSFSRGGTLEVIINPRDVVSVPTDAADRKVRVCRYVVGKATEQPYAGPLAGYDPEDDEDDLEDDYEYAWGDGEYDDHDENEIIQRWW